MKIHVPSLIGSAGVILMVFSGVSAAILSLWGLDWRWGATGAVLAFGLLCTAAHMS